MTPPSCSSLLEPLPVTGQQDKGKLLGGSEGGAGRVLSRVPSKEHRLGIRVCLSLPCPGKHVRAYLVDKFSMFLNSCPSPEGALPAWHTGIG